MSKGNVKSTQPKKEEENGSSPGRQKSILYQNSRGFEVLLQSIPPLLITRIAETVPIPPVPTYEVETASGDVEVFPHDESTLETDEDKKMWNNYKKELDLAEDKITLKILHVVLMEGVDFEIDESDFESWKQKMAILGIELPETEQEILLRYKETKVVADPWDMEQILANVMRLSGISDDVLDVARKSFPNKVEPEAQS